MERQTVIGEVGAEREVGCRVNFRRAWEFVDPATTADAEGSVEGGGGGGIDEGVKICTT